MKIVLYIVVIAMLLSCNNNDSLTEPDYGEKTFNIEGEWYISGSTEGYLQNDSTRYNYNDNVLGYQEYTIKLIQGEDNYYSVSFRMKFIKQKEGESDEDYADRIITGQYSSDELVMLNESVLYNWFVSNNDIYIPWDGKKYKGLLIAKIVSCSPNQFTIISISPNVYDFVLYEPLTYKYYITFTRIR